jgi:hypothetical protein
MNKKTIKVQPWGESQGDFVNINESDFDENVHTLYKEPKRKGAKAADDGEGEGEGDEGGAGDGTGDGDDKTDTKPAAKAAKPAARGAARRK